MAAFDYDDTPYPIRDDIVAAHREYWSHLARPGTWWTGQQRIAIADECRRALACPLCTRRKDALSPYGIDGGHDHADMLPIAAVDAAHRIATDPARLTRRWFDDQQLSDGHYVELVSIVCCMASIDGFHRALGLRPEPLPEPRPGNPSEYRPAGLTDTVGWVPVIDPRRVGPSESDLFSSPMPGHIVQALSLVPDELRRVATLHAAHYLPFDEVAKPTNNGGRHLQRPQIELVAARVSAYNECFY